jgi:hypothetical protein
MSCLYYSNLFMRRNFALLALVKKVAVSINIFKPNF